MKKDCFAYFLSIKDESNLKRVMSNNEHTLSGFLNEFKTVYIINLYNLNLNRRKIDNSNFFPQLNLNKNYIYFEPKDLNSFKEFIKDKKVFGIIAFGIFFTNIKLLFHLKHKNIKLFQISNVGNVNISNLVYIDNNFIKNFFSVINHRFNHILIVILSNLNFVPKVEVRFLSNKRWLPNLVKKSFFKTIFNKFNLSYAKRLEVINSRSYDLLQENRLDLDEKYITVLDEIWNDPQYLIYRGKISNEKLKKHYESFSEKLCLISNFLNKEIIICIHPNDNLDEKKNFFPKFKVKKYQTREYIYKSKLVMLFESSAIIDAIILKKHIINISTSLMDKSQIYHQEHLNKELKIDNLNLDTELIFDEKTRNKFSYNEDKINFYYDRYIKMNIAADETKMLGYKKVAKILKEEFYK